jgi:sugar lactone lactonase YvrE
MMYLETPPRLIETKIFTAMPDKFRRKGMRTDWPDANRPGVATDSFIEGPSFDKDGHLYIVDIPFGRIFRIAPDGELIARINHARGRTVPMSPSVARRRIVSILRSLQPAACWLRTSADYNAL